jgi:tetratricopeptide (TPR) repeat protein
LALKGQIPRAIGEYEKALSLEPVSGAAHLGLGSALEAQGRHQDAIVHLQKAAQSADTNAAEAAREALQSIGR